MSKVLIAYFSRKGNNYVSGNVVKLAVGNTEVAAKKIQSYTGGDLFEIKTVHSYSEDYHKCTEEAKQELHENVRPKLTDYIPDMDRYEVIYLGYPNWWGTMPMAVFTFLDSHIFSGKAIIPFCTHEGSGMGISERDIKKLCPDTEVISGLAIYGSQVAHSDETIAGWVKENETQTSAPSQSEETETGLGNSTSQSSEAQDTGTDGTNILVVYFSQTGNTEIIAKMAANITGGDLFKAGTVTPYPEDYDECVGIAREEQDNDARPELSAHLDDMSRYDVIFLGYPNWWGTMPMAMFTFLEEYDFSGKTIIPFCTHGGSALGSSESDIASLCPDALLLDGFAVSGSSVEGAEADVEDWINGLGVLD